MESKKKPLGIFLEIAVYKKMHTQIHTHTVFLFTMGKNTLTPSNIHPGKLLNDFLSVPAVCGDWLEVDGASQESLGLKRLQGPQIYRKEGEWMVTC